jgi:hypothetical protein
MGRESRVIKVGLEPDRFCAPSVRRVIFIEGDGVGFVLRQEGHMLAIIV